MAVKKMSMTQVPVNQGVDETFYIQIDEKSTTLTHPSVPKGMISQFTSSIAGKFFNSNVEGTDILPPVIRSFTPSFSYALFERQPFTAHIRFKPAEAGMDADIHEFTLEIPWTVYYASWNTRKWTLNNLSIWTRNDPIYSEDDILYKLPMPNTYGNGDVCLGETYSISENTSLADRAKAVLGSFWASSFNMDVNEQLGKRPEEFGGTSTFFDQEDQDQCVEDTLTYLKKWSLLTQDETLTVNWIPTPLRGSGIDHYPFSLDTNELLTVGHILRQMELVSNREVDAVLAHQNPFGKLMQGLLEN